jgi:hypothetical protein
MKKMETKDKARHEEGKTTAFDVSTTVARFFLIQRTKTGKNVPYKIFYMATKHTKWP